MTSQSECVLKWYGSFSPFLITLWLYISPLTAKAMVSSLLVRGCAPLSVYHELNPRLRIVLTHTDTHDGESLVAERRTYSIIACANIVSAPIWTSMANLLCHANGCTLEGNDIWLTVQQLENGGAHEHPTGNDLNVLVTSKDTTHIER